MVSLKKWLGPGAIVGGLGVAMMCGATPASADSGSQAGSGDRAAHATAAAPRADRTAAKARTAPVRAASVRNASVGTAPERAASVRATRPAPAASRVAAAPRPAAAQTGKPAAASVPVAPSSTPIDPAQYAGTYYEQGSVKQFFSIGLVNTKAVYSVRPDGTLGVQNSGNYFFNRGLKSSIRGAAVPVNPINTALNVGFGGTPSANPPGNYLILDRAPDYSWVIVSDPSGFSGYVLTRSKTIDPQTYAQLVARAQELGVRGRITPTKQFPA